MRRASAAEAGIANGCLLESARAKTGFKIAQALRQTIPPMWRLDTRMT